MTFTLRDYQRSIIEQARDAMRQGIRSILLQAPTGSGKTVLSAYMIANAAQRGKRTWFVVHRRELIAQSSRTFRDAGVRHGVVSPGYPPRPGEMVQVCSVMSLANRLHLLPKPDMIVWDECHHITAGSWRKIRERHAGAFHIGLSATPQRLDGAGLGEHFETMILGPTTRWLIDNGHLSDFVYYAPGTPNLDKVHTRAGDYATGELAAEMDKPSITGDALKHYQRLSPGKRAVAFAVNIEHSRHIAAQFQQAGIPSAHIDGTTEQHVRDRLVEQFRRGEILVLSNVDLFGEGFDLPAIETAILLRPTKSLSLYLQQVGRALRRSPGKERAVILDHAGNVRTFGMPDDEREWKLEMTRTRGNSRGGLSVRVCPQCFAAMPSGKPSCICGYVFPVKVRQVESVEGELQEVTAEQRKAMRRARAMEESRAVTFEQLVALATRRGYANPEAWASIRLRARRKRKVVAA